MLVRSTLPDEIRLTFAHHMLQSEAKFFLTEDASVPGAESQCLSPNGQCHGDVFTMS